MPLGRTRRRIQINLAVSLVGRNFARPSLLVLQAISKLGVTKPFPLRQALRQAHTAVRRKQAISKSRATFHNSPARANKMAWPG